MRTKLNAQFKDSVTGQVSHSSPTSWLRTAIVNGFIGTSANLQATTLCLLDNTGAKKDCAPISWGSVTSSTNSATISGTATIKATSGYTVGGYAIYNNDTTPQQMFSSTISTTYSVVTNQQVTVNATLSASQSSSSFSSSAGGTATINVTNLLTTLISLMTSGITVGTSTTYNANVLVPSAMSFYSGTTWTASGSTQVFSQTGLGASNVSADTTNFKDTITVSIAPANAFTFQSCYLDLTAGPKLIGVESISTAQSVPSGVTSTITIVLQW
ncbi:MAG: hypothetical protein ACP5HH_07170 [Fervidicoccaceae archaeon]